MSIFKILSIITITSLSIFIYIYNQISEFRVKDIKIISEKLTNNIKITQLSDFHSNSLINLSKLSKEIEVFNPDFIVLSGDMLDSSGKNLNTLFKLLDNLIKLNKDIYFIEGNHEINSMLYNELRAEMKRVGIIILEDDSKSILVNDQNINITGLKFYPLSREIIEKSKYQQAIKNLNLDYYNILLIHSPNNVKNLINENQDLVLSGHTHGGQLRLPIIGPIIAPGQGFFPKSDKGIFKVNNAKLYIDSGLGNSVLPLRTFNPVQFSNITIEPMNEVEL